MTTAPARRSPAPTPRDLAQRPAPAPLASDALIETLSSLPDGAFLAVWYRGMDSSSMGRSVRLVGAALAELADPDSGQIPPHRQPRAAGLMTATGLARYQIDGALSLMRKRLWLQIRRAPGPNSRSYDRCDLLLRIPARYLPGLTK